MDEVITYKQWKKKYKPRVIEEAGPDRQVYWIDTKVEDVNEMGYYDITNRTPEFTWFDTTKEDYDLMMDYAEPNTVWTERYNEDDKPYLTSGVCIVDRHCYYITKKSHNGRDITVYG